MLPVDVGLSSKDQGDYVLIKRYQAGIPKQQIEVSILGN
jgi:hypothetical protein